MCFEVKLMKKRRVVSYAKYGYIFCIPFVAAFLLFMLYPLFFTATIGFTDLRGAFTREYKILENPFENFRLMLFDNPTFRNSIVNTAKIWLVNFIPQMLLALLLTAWFTNRRSKLRGQGAFKVIFYMPNIITAATIALLFRQLFLYADNLLGPVNYLLTELGILDKGYNFLASKEASQDIISFIQFWMWYGYTMLILISGVLGLNPEMYEVSEIDGATATQQFFFITLPNLRTILLFTLVTSLVGGLNMFDIPMLFNGGGPDNSTNTVARFIYRQAFNNPYLYNRAAAASMILFVIIAALSAVIFFLLRDKDASREQKLLRAEGRAERKARRDGI
jgi:multiple sugar transport system permease protein